MQTNTEEKCIIIVNGKKYDVTEWRHKHPGGDVYTNGADMTKAFMANHGHDLSRLQPFEVKEDNSDTKTVQNSEKKAEPAKINEAIQIIDRSDDATDTPKLYSMDELDKALEDEDL